METTSPWWAEFLSHWPFMCILSCGALHLALSCYLRSYNNRCATFFPCFRIDKLACVLLCASILLTISFLCSFNIGSFHVKSTQKILALTDLNKTRFWHSGCWDINPQWVSASYSYPVKTITKVSVPADKMVSLQAKTCLRVADCVVLVSNYC